jgi:copper resistance protein C
MKKVSYNGLATTIVAILLLFSVPVSAHHQFLQEAYPPALSHSSAVSKVKLMFQGKADALYSTMKLIQADGSVVAAATQPKASREMIMTTPDLLPGPYLVEYRVLTTDGDVVKGDFFFTVDERT